MVTDNLVKKGWFTGTFQLQICLQLIILIYLINYKLSNIMNNSLASNKKNAQIYRCMKFDPTKSTACLGSFP